MEMQKIVHCITVTCEEFHTDGILGILRQTFRLFQDCSNVKYCYSFSCISITKFNKHKTLCSLSVLHTLNLQ